MRQIREYTGCIVKLLIIFLVFQSTALIAQESDTQDELKPVIHIAEKNYNFGEVTEGEKIQHDFSIMNSGTSDLLIQRVIAGCGCTAAAVLNESIPPNTETKITVSLDTLGLAGMQNKSVRIFTNDPVNSISTVSLSGAIKQKISADPANVIFENVFRAQKTPLERIVIVRTDKTSAVKIGDINTFSSHLKIENISGDEHEKKFTIVLEGNVPLGDFRERVIVTLDGDAKSSLNIPVYANVKGNLIVDPPALSFGIISGTEIIKKKLTIENNSDLAYNLESVDSSNKAISAKIKEVKPGKKYNVEVLLDPNKLESDLRSELKFNAETEMEESIAINVYGVFPPKL